ncbi:MAG: glycosyltransferase, partial [Spirochaetota bacterium]
LAHHELLQSGLLQRARALVTASTTENQPVSVLEAIGLGRPVIVPDVEGISELVEGNGSLFPAGDAAALAAELLRMAGDDAFFEECAAEARALARAGRYAAVSLAERYERIYLGLELGVEIEGAGQADGVEYGQGRKLHELQC